MPSPSNPSFTLKVAGSTYNLYSKNGWFDEWTVYARGTASSLRIVVRGGKLPGLPDDFLGKSAQLYYNIGAGDVLGFTGDWVDCSFGYTRFGWGRSYTALGLRYRGDLVPITNSNDGTDLLQYNVARDDPKYNAALAGRTSAEILQNVLDQVDNINALTALGIGNYSSAGWGATAVATISGGVVNSVTPVSLGQSYTTAPNAVAVGGGGSGVVLTPVVSGGQVTSYTINNGGHSFTSAPIIIVSGLPVQTLLDLANLLIIAPFPVMVQGERLIEAIEGTLSSLQPNHTLQIDPSGNLRIYDLRNLPTPHTFTLDSDPIDVSGLQLTRSVHDNYSRVVVRGTPYVQAVELSLSDGSLTEQFAHDGLTTAQAKAAWKLGDYIQPGDAPGTAQLTPVRAGGVITSLTVASGGYGYGGTTPAIRVLRGPGDTTGGGASYTANMSGGVLVSVNKISGGSAYTVDPIIAVDEPTGGNGDAGSCTMPSTTTVTVTSSNPSKTWPANYWDQSATGRQAFITLTNPLDTTINTKIQRKIIANTALTAGGTCTLTLDSPAPNTGYTLYALHGLAGGNQTCWQDYGASPAALAQHLVDFFPYPVTWRSSQGDIETLTSVPVASILYSPTGQAPYDEAPLPFSLNTTTGKFHFARPVVTLFGNKNNLLLGGSHTDGIPADIRILVGVANGVLNAICPANGGYYGTTPQYAGTSNSVEGLTRTLTVTAPQWKDPSNQANMNLLACEILDSVKDTIVEGVIPIIGFFSTAFAFGMAASLTGNGYTTGFEGLNLPVVGCTVKFPEQSGMKYLTTLKVSNRRAQYSQELFIRPPQVPTPFGLGEGGETFYGGDRGNFPQAPPGNSGSDADTAPPPPSEDTTHEQ